RQHAEHRRALSPGLSAALEAFGRRHHLTQSTLVLAAWSLVLSRYAGEREVVFGVTVSGRSAPLEGIESMLGLFINTIPARVDVDPGAPVVAWLERLQQRQVAARAHEHAPLVEVQQLCALPRGSALFESVLVFENYPVERSLGRAETELRIHEATIEERTNY